MKFKNNGFFFKILSCFIAVILIISIAFGILQIDNSHRIRNIAKHSLEQNFRDNAEDVSRIISQIRYTMSELSVKIAASDKFENGSYIDDNSLRAEMRAIFVDRRQNEFSKYLSGAFLVDTQKSGYIYELTGTYAADIFYNQFFVNETYNADFWLSRAGKGKMFEVFPSSVYTTVRDAKRVDIELMPIVYKPATESRYVTVVLIDAVSLSEDYGISGIRTKEGDVIHLSGEVVAQYGEEDIFESKKIKSADIFNFSDDKNGELEIFDVVSPSEVRAEKQSVVFIYSFVFVILAILSLLFSLVISKIAASKIRDISEMLMSNPIVRTQFESGINSFKELFLAVKIISSQERSMAPVGKNGDSVLDSMLLQAHMRDVYAGIQDIEAQVNYSKAFFMIYFKVSYMKKFNSYMKEDTGKATFLLKQLIEMYLETWGISAVTFQTERDGIVSVFDAAVEVSPQNILDDILKKLSNESEYAYFTVSVSDVHGGADNIKEVYGNLLEAVKYAKPITETQVLSENQGKGGVSRFYFSVEEMGKLSALLQNGTEEDAIKKIDEIIEYNLRKEVNRFEMHLLCTEIVNCAIKLVNRVFYTVPESVDVSSVYGRLSVATTPEEYREICFGFVHDIMEFIKENKREDDYIISYIFDYVENHYSEDIYLNLFAEKLKLTGAYISSYFKEKTNINLTDYINNYRIKKAVILSENPQNKNKDIAEMVGLPNINTFIRLFKKYTGYTPGEYRKKHFGEDSNS